VPAGGEPGEREKVVAAETEASIGRLRVYHDSLDFRRAAAETRAIWARANTYIQGAAPWAELSRDRARAIVTTRLGLALVRLSAAVAWSIIPTLASKVLGALGDDHKPPGWPIDVRGELLGDSLAGRPLTHLAPLVSKLTAADVERLSVRFECDTARPQP
jgi:methionyl-tRNA synthetase